MHLRAILGLWAFAVAGFGCDDDAGSSADAARLSDASPRTDAISSHDLGGRDQGGIDLDGGGGDAGGPPALAETFELEGDDLVPESGDFDPESRAFYVSSLVHGTVTRIRADGTQETFAEAPEPGMGTLGVRIDGFRRRLWTCAVNLESLAGQVWVFDLETGERTLDLDLSAVTAEASCNDIAFDLQGFAYVTDRENPNVYRIDPATQTAELFVTDPRLTGSIGMNGIALTEDGRAMIVSVLLPAALYRIDLGEERTVAPVALTGDAFRGTAALTGADGLRMASGELLVALIDRLARVVPDNATWASATVRTEEIPDGTSAVVLAEGAVYGIQSDIVDQVLGRPLSLPFTIKRLGAAELPR
jgi:sugar lactone lactonase YvrE